MSIKCDEQLKAKVRSTILYCIVNPLPRYAIEDATALPILAEHRIVRAFYNNPKIFDPTRFGIPTGGRDADNFVGMFLREMVADGTLTYEPIYKHDGGYPSYRITHQGLRELSSIYAEKAVAGTIPMASVQKVVATQLGNGEAAERLMAALVQPQVKSR